MSWAASERTRFLLFPRPPGQEELVEPEVVEVSPEAGSIGPGPADDRMYAIYPHDKLVTYGSEINRNGETFSPPWFGPIHEPATPDENGHFTHLPISLVAKERNVLDSGGPDWRRVLASTGQPASWS